MKAAVDRAEKAEQPPTTQWCRRRDGTCVFVCVCRMERWGRRGVQWKLHPLWTCLGCMQTETCCWRGVGKRYVFDWVLKAQDGEISPTGWKSLEPDTVFFTSFCDVTLTCQCWGFVAGGIVCLWCHWNVQKCLCCADVLLPWCCRTGQFGSW